MIETSELHDELKHELTPRTNDPNVYNANSVKDFQVLDDELESVL